MSARNGGAFATRFSCQTPGGNGFTHHSICTATNYFTYIHADHLQLTNNAPFPLFYLSILFYVSYDVLNTDVNVFNCWNALFLNSVPPFYDSCQPKTTNGSNELNSITSNDGTPHERHSVMESKGTSLSDTGSTPISHSSEATTDSTNAHKPCIDVSGEILFENK